VANQAAQLIRGGSEAFGPGNDGPESSDATEKKRVPVREMLKAMEGDEAALGQFIAIMNDMQETEDWPTQHIVWKEADLKKALAGDPTLKSKLEADLNVHLDGTPLSKISLTSYENGIIVETSVPCQVEVGSKVVDMRGPIQVPYRPNVSKSIAKDLKEKSYDLTTLAGYYALEAQKIEQKTSQKENVEASLKQIIDPATNAELARPAQQVLKSATIVVTDQYIDSASFKNYDSGGENLNDMTIELNEEGRKRLWQYSRRRVGSQLLLIVNGVAIAAPRIRHELAQGELQISQLPDKILVQDAVDSINKKQGVKP
jgi:hypothetical protein